jgi:hypothetical protein
MRRRPKPPLWRHSISPPSSSAGWSCASAISEIEEDVRWMITKSYLRN